MVCLFLEKLDPVESVSASLCTNRHIDSSSTHARKVTTSNYAKFQMLVT